MAAEPFTTLSIASNAIQFVDFTWKLVGGCRTIYKSSSGASRTSEVLHVIIADVNRLANAVSASSSHAALDEISKECKTVAKDLLELLETLVVKGKRTKWKSFAVAMKEVWSKGKIDKLLGSLAGLQSQLGAQLQWLLMNQVSSIAATIRDIQNTNIKLDMKRRADINALRRDVLDALAPVQLDEGSLATAGDRVQRVVQSNLSDSEDLSSKFQRLSIAITTLETEGNKAADDVNLLRSLYFTDLMTRHSRIEDAHAKTFTWIFKEQLPNSAKPLNFVEWLRAQTGIYWIQGKPGSGKSTLMKYICDHPETRENLDFWAKSKGKTLVIARFFIWLSGSKLQKSQEGLLRGLLFEILRECPELTEHVLATRSGFSHEINLDSLDYNVLPWTRAELLAVFQHLAKQDLSTRFCFFIDALDEYEEDKKTHDELIKCLYEISKSDDIKLCVSSRPWTVFMDAFGQSPWLIKLEDLTREDIRQYVSDKLGENQQYGRLKARDQGYQELASDVVRKAQGVFLWVYLVVRELLEGLNYSDSVKLMRMRLEQFPEDLDDFFQRMVQSIPKIYRPKTARTFRLATAINEPLPLMTYALLDDVEEDPELSFRLATEPLSPDEFAFKIDTMRRRIDGRCKGLLEIVRASHSLLVTSSVEPAFEFEVDFLHRTVRDFLSRSEDISRYVRESSDKESETWRLCSHALVAQVKVSPPDTTRLHRFLDLLFFFAHMASEDEENLEIIDRLLDEADESYIFSRSRLEPTWPQDKSALVGLACQNGLFPFVRRKVKSSADFSMSSLDRRGPPMLWRALTPHRFLGQIFPDIIQHLLQCGADPNEFYSQSSPFITFIKLLYYKDTSQEQEPLLETTRVLLEYGANIGATFITTHYPAPETSVTVRSVLKQYFGTEKYCWVTRKGLGPERDVASQSSHMQGATARNTLGTAAFGQTTDNANLEMDFASPITGHQAWLPPMPRTPWLGQSPLVTDPTDHSGAQFGSRQRIDKQPASSRQSTYAQQLSSPAHERLTSQTPMSDTESYAQESAQSRRSQAHPEQQSSRWTRRRRGLRSALVDDGLLKSYKARRGSPRRRGAKDHDETPHADHL